MEASGRKLFRKNQGIPWNCNPARLVSVKVLHRVVPGLDAVQIATWFDSDLYAGGRDAGKGGPGASVAAVIETVLIDFPREEAVALILADATLAQSMGWDHVVPLIILVWQASMSSLCLLLRWPESEKPCTTPGTKTIQRLPRAFCGCWRSARCGFFTIRWSPAPPTFRGFQKNPRDRLSIEDRVVARHQLKKAIWHYGMRVTFIGAPDKRKFGCG